MASEHSIRLVAPWYRWARQAERHGLPPRGTRPVFQKFASPDFVNGFLADPQRSYTFGSRDLLPAAEASPYTSSIRSVADVGVHPTELRKLFQDVHKRHYLVVCEMHCDLPGFPDARLEHACEMGFVARRRRPVDAAGIRDARARLRRRAGIARAGLLRFTHLRLGLPVPHHLRGDPKLTLPGPVHALEPSEFEEIAEAYRRELERIRVRRSTLERLDEVPWILEGWVPDPDRPGIGRWEPVDATPDPVRETIHPLTPLVPDPGAEAHSGGGATILFGAAPTSTADTDARGEPRFDARHVYQIRCFVRQHDDRCPRTRERADCPGPLVWSEPGRAYAIAAHNDIDGTRNCVVTAELPDIGELAARAAALPPGAGGGVRMAAPEDSTLEFDADGMDASGGRMGDGEICTFAIPLITIVATFLLRLVLPVVVFLFNLYFLLRLKFCIPPSFSIDAGLVADVEAAGGSLEGDPVLRARIAVELNDAFPTGPGGVGVGNRLASGDEYTTDELWEMLRDLEAASGADEDEDDEAENGGPLTADLVLEERIEVRPRVDEPALLAGVSA